MVREPYTTQKRRTKIQQYRAFKVTKTMAPTSTSYSLRSGGLPTVNIEHPIRTRKVSAKVAENEEIEAIQARAVTKGVIEAFQPVINALTSQVALLSAALEEQRKAVTT